MRRMADANVKARLLDLGGIEMEPNTPAEFAKFIAADTAKWTQGGAVRPSQAGMITG